VSHSSVSRIWKARNLQIQLPEAFKARDIAGLYVNSLDAVAVFIGDNNSQDEPPDDPQPVLRAEPRVFVRRPQEIGTPSQLEGLRVTQVLRRLLGGVDSAEARDRLSFFLEFLLFLGQLDANREVHVVALRTGLLKHPTIKAWFSARARYHVHYVPLGSERVWIGKVVRWLTDISREGRRAAGNVQDLLDATGNYLEKGDRQFPFVWWAPPLNQFRSRTDRRLEPHDFDWLPEGVELAPGSITVRFRDCNEALRKLMALVMAISQNPQTYRSGCLSPNPEPPADSPPKRVRPGAITPHRGIY
jgi:hypothetical protein